MIQPPLDEAEKLKMREQFRDFESEKFLLAMKVYADQSYGYSLNAYENVKQYGLQSVKHLTLLNGGAIIALLSLVGALISKSDQKSIMVAISFLHSLAPALFCFAGGLVASGLLAALIWRNWLAIANTYQSPKHLSDLISKGECDVLPDTARKVATITHFLIYLFGWSSLVLFLLGAWIVCRAFEVLGL
ncbi:hypothetical protein [Methylobacterium sp. D54C]